MMEVTERENISYLYGMAQNWDIYLSQGTKFIIQDWYYNLRNGFLDGSFKADDREEQLPFNELVREYAIRLFPEFLFQFFPDSRGLKEDIGYDQERARWTYELERDARLGLLV